MRRIRTKLPGTAALTLFWPGGSWLHRASAGMKLLALAGGSAAVVALDRPVVSGGLLLVAIGCILTAGVPPSVLARLMRPFLLVVLLLVGVQALIGRTIEGLAAGSRLLAVAALASAVTLTTRSTDLVAWFERVLTWVRLPPGAVFRVGLAVGVSMRSLDHLGVLAQRVLDARRARGLHRSVRAFAVPTVVAAARFAHGVGEALDARGIADPEPSGARGEDHSR